MPLHLNEAIFIIYYRNFLHCPQHKVNAGLLYDSRCWTIKPLMVPHLFISKISSCMSGTHEISHFPLKMSQYSPSSCSCYIIHNFNQLSSANPVIFISGHCIVSKRANDELHFSAKQLFPDPTLSSRPLPFIYVI